MGGKIGGSFLSGIIGAEDKVPIQWDRDLLEILEAENDFVVVEPTRITYYSTGWEYEEPEYIRSNEELMAAVHETVSDLWWMYDEIGCEDDFPKNYLPYVA